MSGAVENKFDNIGLSGHAVGVLACSDKGLEWKGENTATKLVQAKDIARASWEVFGKFGHLRLFLRNGKSLRYDGFSRGQFDKLKEILGGYGVELSPEDLYPGGVNYGEMVFAEDSLIMQVEDESGEEPSVRKVLELPLKSVSQCVLPGNQVKNEVELQFVETDTADREEDTLVEIRFYIPPGEQEDEVVGAEKFRQDILERANVQQKTGEAILTFSEADCMFLSPRGRYEINLYRAHFRIHGAKYDHKMAYEDVNNFFLLERPRSEKPKKSRGDEDKGEKDDQAKIFFFVISLKRPIHQGQQRYSHLVLQTTDANGDITSPIAEDEMKKLFGDKLQKDMHGSMHMLIARCFRDISSKKVFTSRKFLSATESNGVRCNLKTADGFLFPLDKAFMFVPKPTQYIPYKEVESVSFERVPTTGMGGTRAFDLKVVHRPMGGDTRKEYMFSDISKDEFEPLTAYLHTKEELKIRVNKPVSQTKISDMLDEDEADTNQQGGDDEEDEEDDEDYVTGGSDDSGGSGGESDSDSSSGAESVQEDFSHYNKEKGKGKGKKSSKKAKADDEEGGGGAESDGDKAEAVEDSGKGKKKRKPKAPKEPEADGAKKRKPKKKRKKDPNAPKGALSAYIIYSNESRDKVKEENPGIKITEISKLLGEKWKTLDAEAKQVYVDKALVDKERYKAEMAEYLKNKPPSEPEDEEEKPDDSDEADSD